MTSRILAPICLVVVLLVAVAASHAGPRMVLNEESFDFGLSPQNAKVSHVFWLKSVGDDTLKILNVKPGCGCTKAPLEKTVLAPGDSTRLEIIFSTGRYTGVVTKHPRVSTNEGGPDRTITFVSNVTTRPDSTYPLIVEPYKLDFSRLGNAASHTMPFVVKNVSDQDLGVTVIGVPEDILDISLPEQIPAGSSVTGEVKLIGTAGASREHKSITLSIDDELHTRITIPVLLGKPTSSRAASASSSH